MSTYIIVSQEFYSGFASSCAIAHLKCARAFLYNDLGRMLMFSSTVVCWNHRLAALTHFFSIVRFLINHSTFIMSLDTVFAPYFTDLYWSATWCGYAHKHSTWRWTARHSVRSQINKRFWRIIMSKEESFAWRKFVAALHRATLFG